MRDYPAVIPMIAYEDGPKAMDWLSNAFGFKERMRMVTPEGRLSHGEMEAGDGLLMLATPSLDYEAPKKHREGGGQGAKESSGAYILGGVPGDVPYVLPQYQRAPK